MHIPVMLDEVLEYLMPLQGKTIVDCTIGQGGHSYAIIKRLLPEGKLIGIDKDIEALNAARERLKDFAGLFILINGNFRDIHSILDAQGIRKVDGLLFDLGLSSSQLEDAERGLSFLRDGPLDMRMDKTSRLRASDIVNDFPQDKLKDLLERYGQERYSGRIARNIVLYRKRSPILTTSQLVCVIKESVPHRAAGKRRLHPATRAFQALRIAVNRELESLQEALDKAPDCLNAGGRICVLTYHSLEDRIVKITFRGFKNDGILKLITEKPLATKRAEVLQNPRSRSAKLRVAELNTDSNE